VRPDHANDGLGGGASASCRHPPKGFGNCGCESHRISSSSSEFMQGARFERRRRDQWQPNWGASYHSTQQTESQKDGNKLAASRLQNMDLACTAFLFLIAGLVCRSSTLSTSYPHSRSFRTERLPV
jgi:hypothetical protein